MKEMGRNVVAQVTEKNELLVRIDLSREFGRSKSGKTIIIASSEGNKKLEDINGGEVFLGMNCYKK